MCKLCFITNPSEQGMEVPNDVRLWNFKCQSPLCALCHKHLVQNDHLVFPGNTETGTWGFSLVDLRTIQAQFLLFCMEANLTKFIDQNNSFQSPQTFHRFWIDNYISICRLDLCILLNHGLLSMVCQINQNWLILPITLCQTEIHHSVP